MCTLFANHYVLLTWGPHMVYMGSPYTFYIYMIKCGWLGIIILSISQHGLLVMLTICNDDEPLPHINKKTKKNLKKMLI